ncbi:class I SAM-dependent methyltransferase [Lentilactobacillus kosonis]|uniref:Methyltransferase type 11 domain-containing protein n=1 Tax=Lentilactobacillus kosonis TaxID=2810561 RepID=A0A401FNF1_9LACO|nr:class I SAM-dependent methyltransferase [Lentilactobacillus kosonis]GAY73836.1 hypothetical protein NBRC111893_1982 [Lentilactobacillus kosonis]
MKKGVDAPLVPVMFLLIGIIGLIMGIISENWTRCIVPIVFLLFGVVYLHTSLFGKYKLIKRIVTGLNLNSNAQVLDLGTGHGAFLIEIAKRLKEPGKVIGLDIWNQGDQLGNSAVETQRNIEQAGVSTVSELVTGDMTKLAFKENQFDYVVASLSIHNVKPKASRLQAIDEAYRVLKPDGKIIIWISSTLVNTEIG